MTDSGDFATKAKAGLTSKVAGIPLYIYGGAFVIGFYAYKKWVASKTPAVAPVTADVVRPGGLTAATDSKLPTGSSGSVTGGGGGTNLTSNPGLLDTTTWVNQGTAYLAAIGYDGTKANQYLSAYVTGVQPTGDAQRYVSLVISRFGPPAGQNPVQPGDALNSPSLVRIIRRADNPAIFGQYSDGSVHWFPNPSDLYSAAKSTGDSSIWSGNAPVINSISANDPLWTAAGVQFSNTWPYVPITVDTPKGAGSVVTRSTYSPLYANDAIEWAGHKFFGWSIVGTPGNPTGTGNAPFIPGTAGDI